MKTLENIQSILTQHKEELKDRYKVIEIGIFGSYVREKEGKDSDIEMVIEFENEESVKSFEYIRLMNDLEKYLESILHIKPHLASKRHASSSDKWKEIEKEIVYIFEKIERKKLKEEIIKILNKMKIEMKNIILFGSRARGEYNKYSDWDFLIIVNENVALKEKRKLAKAIRERLADFYIPCDVIIKSENEIDYYKEFIGSVTREALKEGVSI